jgi:hypothetical protein
MGTLDALRCIDFGPTDENGCWRWIGSLTPKGYGRFWFKGRLISAHRWAYEHFVGPIQAGMQIDHLCRNHACVRPDHLEVVTCRENLMRGETLAAANARKAHCNNGHEYTPENTYQRPAGRRECRSCWKAQNDRSAEYRRQYYKRRHQIIPEAESK